MACRCEKRGTVAQPNYCCLRTTLLRQMTKHVRRFCAVFFVALVKTSSRSRSGGYTSELTWYIYNVKPESIPKDWRNSYHHREVSESIFLFCVDRSMPRPCILYADVVNFGQLDQNPDGRFKSGFLSFVQKIGTKQDMAMKHQQTMKRYGESSNTYWVHKIPVHLNDIRVLFLAARCSKVITGFPFSGGPPWWPMLFSSLRAHRRQIDSCNSWSKEP